LGELARAFLLSRKADLGFWQVFSTILIERALDIIMAAGILLVSLPFVVNASWALQAALGVGGLVLFGLVLLFLAARNPTWVTNQFERLSQRWPAIGKLGSKHLSAFLSGLLVLNNTRRFLSAILWMMANWGLAVLQYYVLLSAFYPHAKPLWAVFSLGVVALGAAAPSSNYVVTGILGSYGLVMDGFSLTGLYREVKEIEPDNAPGAY